MRVSLFILVGLWLAAAACQRERRDDAAAAPPDDVVGRTLLTDLRPGGADARPASLNPLLHNAYSMSEGKRLFSTYNCVGCHAHGGGAIGPALMDSVWIYGGRPEQIYATIMQGRPNGMPAFRDRLSPLDAWRLVAYVQSLSGQAPPDAAPGRDDAMSTTVPESRRTPGDLGRPPR